MELTTRHPQTLDTTAPQHATRLHQPKFSSLTKSYTNTCASSGSVSFCDDISISTAPASTTHRPTFKLSCPGSLSNAFLASSFYHHQYSLQTQKNPLLHHSSPDQTPDSLLFPHLTKLTDTHTLNTTTNPKSHPSSLLTPVNSSFVSSGFPPFGPSKTSSGCCAYSARKARARSAFCAAVTVEWKRKVAILVTGPEGVGEDIVMAMRGLGTLGGFCEAGMRV